MALSFSIMYMHVCAYMCTFMCMNKRIWSHTHMRWSEDKHYLFWENPESSFAVNAQLDDLLTPKIFLSHSPFPQQGCRDYRYSSYSSRIGSSRKGSSRTFYIGSENSNSGLHACMPNVFTTEPSPSACIVPPPLFKSCTHIIEYIRKDISE